MKVLGQITTVIKEKGSFALKESAVAIKEGSIAIKERTIAIKERGFFNRKQVVFKIRRSLLVLKKGLAQETVETKDMLATYHRFTRGQATPEEMQEANRQLKDVFKGLGLSVVVILPFSPITLPAIVKLGEKVGIDVIPSGFKESYAASESEGEPEPQFDKATPQVADHSKT